MPIIDLPRLRLDAPVDTPKGFAVTPGTADMDPETPTDWYGASQAAMKTVGSASPVGLGVTLPAIAASPLTQSAFRQGNTFGSLLSETARADRDAPTRKQEGFHPWEKIKGTSLEEHWESFVDIHNDEAFEARRTKILAEIADRKVVNDAPWYQSVPAQMAAGVLDWPSLLPGGTFVRGAKGGFSVAKSVLSVGTAAGVATGVQEGVLQASQETRPWEESAVNIGASVFLGGLLGGAGARLLSNAEWRGAVQALERELETGAASLERGLLAEGGSPASVGAAAHVPTELGANTIEGRAAGAVAAATERLNPGLRIIQSPSAVVRDIGVHLYENVLYLKKNTAGVASEPAVETLMKEWNGGLAKAVRMTTDSFADYRKGGGALDRAEFREAVGRAMRRADQDPNPHVARVAQQWRKEVIEPLKEEAIKVGLLKPDVSVETAASYFSRMWNRNRLNAQEGRFKEIVSGYYRGAIAQEYESARAQTAARFRRIDQEIEDLKLSGPDRATLLETLSGDLTRLRAGNAPFEDLNRSVGEFHSQAAKARAEGKPDTASQMLSRAKELAEKGGDAYADYVSARNMLAQRVRRIRNNVAGREDQTEAIRQRIADAEVANLDRLRRLHKSLTTLDGQTGTAAPELLEAELSRLRTEFSQVLERSAKAQDRLAKTVGKLTDAARTVDDAAPTASAVPLDFYATLDLARARAADPERKMQKRPVVEMLKRKGGVDPDGQLASELRHAGIDAKNTPGLFKRGGVKTADNFVADEHPLFALDGDERGYIPQDVIINAAREEAAGRPRRTTDQGEQIEAREITDANAHAAGVELEALGIDLRTMDNDAVMRRLSEIQASRNFLADLEAVPAPKGSADYGAAAPEVVTQRQAAIQARIEARTRLFEAAEGKRIEQTAELSERISDLEKIDPEEALRLLRETVEARLEHTAGTIEREGMRIASRLRMIEKADPKLIEGRVERLARAKAEAERRFFDRWETRNLGQGVDPASNVRPDFTDAAREIANHTFDSLTGRAGDSIRPEFVTVGTRGPMKERTFNIPDNLIEDFLEHDVEVVGRRYTRIMGADVELARKFGSPDMKEQLQSVRSDYERLRQGVTDEKELKRLGNRETADLRDLEALRDLLRGSTRFNHPVEENFSRATRVFNHFNYLRSMGEVSLASLTETVRPAMVHGLMPYLGTVASLATNLKAIKMSVAEAKLAGNVSERILGTRLATLSEIVDPYASRGPVEAFMENMTNFASKWNGIRMLTDMQKSISAVMTQDRLLAGATDFAKAKPSERRYLAYLGIDQSMAERIAAQFSAHGQTVDGVRVAGTENWTDDIARRTYRAAINKDIDSIITTKGVADVPLFANTPTGRALLQFKSFFLASHQRVLLRGLQEDQTRFLGGTLAMTGIGMFTTYLKAFSGNREAKLADFAENPGWWVAEGLDKSGIFSVAMELGNVFEKASGFHPIKSPIKAFDQGNRLGQRYQNRNEIGALLGPTVGLGQDVLTTAGVPKKLMEEGKPTTAQKNAMERLMPFNSYAGIRQILRYVVNTPD